MAGLHARAVARSAEGPRGRRPTALVARPTRHDRQPGRRPGRPGAGRRARAGHARTGRSPSSEVADGADAVVLRTTDALPAAQAARRAGRLSPWRDRSTPGRTELAYAVFLTWRGHAATGSRPGGPIRNAPDAPAMHRNEGWKFGFAASRCLVCGFAPPAAHPGVPLLPVGRPDGAGAHGRHAGHRGHLHRRPPGFQPLARLWWGR